MRYTIRIVICRPPYNFAARASIYKIEAYNMPVYTPRYDKAPKRQRPPVGPPDITWLRKTIADCRRWGKHKAVEALTEVLREAEEKAKAEDTAIVILSK